MIDRGTEKQMQREQKHFGIAPGFHQFSPYPFGGIDQQSSRTGMGDTSFFWLENYISIGKGKLRTLWDISPSLYTAPAGVTIVSFFFYNINTTDYSIVFLSDGTAVQLNITNWVNGTSTTVSSSWVTQIPNTFYKGGQLPACVQWGSQYLIICNNNTINDYWVWDGAILYSAGSLAPKVTVTNGGTTYNSPPTVTAFGGFGTGATFAAVLTGENVTSVNMTNPGTGYLPTDTIQLAFSGGGATNSAILTPVLTPTSISSASVVAGGIGYSNTPSATITGGGGSGALATVYATGGVVKTITITAAGSGYTSNPIITISDPTGTGAIAQVFLTPTTLASITITNGGSGFTSTPLLTISGGGGSGAIATASLSSNAVSDITALVGGTGYTTVPGVTFSGGGGSGAIATATISGGAVTGIQIIFGGSGYTSPPSIALTGSSGSGASAIAVLTGSGALTAQITSVNVTNVGSNYTSLPEVIVQSGLNNSAAAIVTLMPFGISGSAIETYLQRVWISYPEKNGTLFTGGVFNVSAPGSFTDFATSDGGYNYVSSDNTLKQQYVNIKQSNGYLYALGDSSVNYISNIQTSGVPITTSFNYQNIDPQVGTPWRDTAQSVSRTILLANPFGVFGIFGGGVQKISHMMDEIFDNAIFPPTAGAITPVAATVSINNKRVYLILITILDPNTQAYRNVLLCWDEKDWFVASQSAALTYIATQESNSDVDAYGTDGTNLYQLFYQPSSIPKTIATKLYGNHNMLVTKEAMGVYLQSQDLSGQGIIFSTMNIVAEHGSYPIPMPSVATGAVPYYPISSIGSGDVVGSNLGLLLTTTSLDHTIDYLSIGYVDVGSIAMSSMDFNGQLLTE